MDSQPRLTGRRSGVSNDPATGGQSCPDRKNDRPPPRYAAIKQSIFDAVRHGRLRPGDRVPSEAELVHQFGVSRMTANRALRELQAAGTLVRRAGSGSFIAEAKPISQMIEIRDIADEIRGRGHAHRVCVIQNREVRASIKTAPLLNVRIGTKLFHSILVHHEDEFPIQIEERFVLASIAPTYGTLDFARMTPNAYLMRIAPLERIEHHVSAKMPDEWTRDMLGLCEGEPILQMMRRTWSRSRLVSHALLAHPGTRFELSAIFSADT